MKYREESVAGEEWDLANSKPMTSGRGLDRNPRTEARLFSMRKDGVVLLSKILLGRGTTGHFP
jgi:hypothetical protein